MDYYQKYKKYKKLYKMISGSSFSLDDEEDRADDMYGRSGRYGRSGESDQSFFYKRSPHSLLSRYQPRENLSRDPNEMISFRPRPKFRPRREIINYRDSFRDGETMRQNQQVQPKQQFQPKQQYGPEEVFSTESSASLGIIDYPDIPNTIILPIVEKQPGNPGKQKIQNKKANIEKREFILQQLGYQVGQPEGLVPIFGYGSNGPTQLKERLGDSNLIIKKALLKNYSRIFCGRGSDGGKWGLGGLASIYPNQGTSVKGSVSYLNLNQLKELSRYEGMNDLLTDKNQVYRYQIVNCAVWNVESQNWDSVLALVYVWNRDLTYQLPPSKSYIDAIKSHLGDFWEDNTIEINGLNDRGRLENHGIR